MARATKASTRIQARSVRQVAIDEVIDRATDVIGDREAALRWVGTPVPALDYATPISLLATSEGKDRVLATLDNLGHGVLWPLRIGCAPVDIQRTAEKAPRRTAADGIREELKLSMRQSRVHSPHSRF
jgi:hypothetical protein